MNVPPTNAEPGVDPGSVFDGIDFTGLKSVIVAVSGGSDSLALLYLLIAFSKSRPSFPDIVAVTIDHGLRPESAEEARYVSRLCNETGISHRILNWAGPKPATGLSAKARAARYALLCEAARDSGTDMILTGHTLDDQIETFVMRSSRTGEGRSERGLAGMAPATLLDREIWLVRPLLKMSRGTLRNYLGSKGITWCEDPSNDDPKYERVRIRKALEQDDRERVHDEIVKKVQQRLLLNEQSAKLLRHCVTVYDGLRVEIRREGWLQQNANAQRLAIGVLLAMVGGHSFLPAADICGKALRHIVADDLPGRITLSRCILQRRKGCVLIYREMRSLPEITIEPHQTAVWDGRYRIGNQTPCPLHVTACGADGLDVLKKDGHIMSHRGSALSGPALVNGGKIVAMPPNMPQEISVTRHLALFDHILSGYDEILAQSVAEIFQAQSYKRCPVNQINKN
ncbi:tRNA lysidine(34) synthetase TilS [Phyllobacterium brassicacearum]|uniref:tRNA(Ile)-lysidine synthase n=1 Tax=Phyllobacterium brassicacearum TaxID=314235 RepID=A0A2P7BRL4_9HYPH|nr:tRNA lysidine(34) synthetase TilS [Phyllobacterium brassicacearum]PSH69113.1 tRNA lysidine(34) synthetase TilS [Phyllobacterium brassicacearum]TDQ25369.1 tRNA(Ile)-lysidine synthase [Phyllobacterium brassicacearum]